QRKREGGAGVLRRGLALAALVLLLGLGLSAVQLLLTADLSATAPHGERGTLEYVTSFSLLPQHLIGLVLPNWRGTPAFNTYTGERYYWEYVLYIGLVPLLLALVGAATRRGRVFALVALVALILALAKGNPLYHILRFIPGFSDFRVPARYIFLFTFAAALLAGCGWEALAAARTVSPRRRAIALAAALAALTVGDLLWFGKTLTPLAGPAVYEATPRVVQILKDDPDWGRALILPPITIYADWCPPGGWAANPDGWLEARVYLPASVPQSFDLRTIGGYAGFVDPRQGMFFQEASTRTFRSDDLALHSLVGTRYFLVGPQMEIEGLQAADIPPFRVYRNPKAFPRAFTIGAVIPASNHAEALAQTVELASQGRLASTAVIRGDLFYFSPVSGTGNILRVDEPRPEHVAVSVQSDEPTLVVLNERWDPGWRARVDGLVVPLVEVDSVLMGAPVPGGEHTVEFEYRPRGLIVGRVISLISLAALVLIIAAPTLAGRRARAS
ncbi:MAG: YfhO family protein, partial [Armatimonadetes bacterium]|nr:YfhO family protein [Armatimonadota bacterium]